MKRPCPAAGLAMEEGLFPLYFDLVALAFDHNVIVRWYGVRKSLLILFVRMDNGHFPALRVGQE